MILANHGIISSSGGVLPIVTNGLILNLDAGNIASYTGSGTTWTDLTGNGNDGTLVNGVGYSSLNGGELTFDGVNDYVDLSDKLKTTNQDLTYDFWIKCNSNTTVYNDIFTQASPTYANYIAIEKSPSNSSTSGGLFFGFQGNTVFDTLTGSQLISANIINYSFILKKVSSYYNLYLYRNGVLINTTVTNVTSYDMTAWGGQYQARIGGGTATYPQPWNGNIYTTRMYNLALSNSEILQNFNATKSRYGL